MLIPSLKNILTTPSEAAFMQEWTEFGTPYLSDKVRAARLVFAQQHPPGVVAELDAMRAPMLILEHGGDIRQSRMERWLEDLSLEAAAEAAKDVVGVEPHLVGPLELSDRELQIFLKTAEYVGVLTAKDLVETQAVIDSTPERRRAAIFETDLMPELLERQGIASSIVAAIHAYMNTSGS